mmetsp:Transcript_7053/g.14163  ORF Transcript_7053/g.14163 Transcript_7053/m.14163 type:complete len:489 (-) Transcript_7053:69-1535(-)|eukprot:CAMPEP_0171558214 /NCGR_PEP_ID=MMETSP0960-20121227/11851_1 /TAXON_ID=87120 /ORGANISM="Aurantiochytrium limacinum, Strain ATCCMYA-1381" /LENGTH=488 /DNA_ID=CAMNT_0012108947 /DNA_START=61 /DNA_END=1527 /DNA_ORIENTATION=-
MSALSAARKHMTAAKGALKTSLFKWSPDYISAAHLYEKAAVSFKAAGDPEQAGDAYKCAAEANSKGDNENAAAKCWESAAEMHLSIFRNQSKGIEGGLQQARTAADYYSQAVMIYRESGAASQASTALSKKGQVLADAAATLPEAHKKRDALLTEALECLMTSCEILEIANKLVFSKDTYRNTFNLVVRMRRWSDALQVLNKMIPVYKELNQTAGGFKLRLSAVIIQLQRNDLTAAKASFREGFDDTAYLSSDECAAAEDLLRAWEDMDEDAVRKVIARPVFQFLEREVALVARDLSPFNSSAQPRDVPLASSATTGSGAGTGARASPATASYAQTGPAAMDAKIVISSKSDAMPAKTTAASTPTGEADAVSDANRQSLFARKPQLAPAPPAPVIAEATPISSEFEAEQMPMAAPEPTPAPKTASLTSTAALDLSVEAATSQLASSSLSDKSMPSDSAAGEPTAHSQSTSLPHDANDDDEDADLDFLR